MDINNKDTAVLVTDPQNDFLSEQGVTWQLVGDSVRENRTVENIERLICRWEIRKISPIHCNNFRTTLVIPKERSD